MRVVYSFVRWLGKRLGYCGMYAVARARWMATYVGDGIFSS